MMDNMLKNEKEVRIVYYFMTTGMVTQRNENIHFIGTIIRRSIELPNKDNAMMFLVI